MTSEIPTKATPRPREGLPPKVREACFDGRLALLFPKGSHGDGPARLVLGEAGELFDCMHAKGRHHEMRGARVQVVPDGELDAAFERGAEWVRTGELP